MVIFRNNRKILLDKKDFNKVKDYTISVYRTRKPTKTRKAHFKVKLYIKRGNRPTLARYILGITDPNVIVDHINNNQLDNRRKNLRLVDSKINQRNRSARINSSSKYKGVFLIKKSKKWCAQIRLNGKIISLGTFVKEKDAAKAYDTASIKYFGDILKLNLQRNNK